MSAVQGQLWGSRAPDWATVQEGQVAAGYDAVLSSLSPLGGKRLLDIGCGAGMFAARAAVHGAVVAGLDASAPLLAIARSRVPDGDFVQGDMGTLPFADHSFDVVTGFNAFQFVASPSGALAEARRVLRPDGHLAVMVWAEPHEMAAASVITALRVLLPPPPAETPGPFALSESGTLWRFAEDAGFDVLTVEDVETAFSYPDMATALRGWNSSGVAARAMEVAGEDAVIRTHRTALDTFVRADGSLWLPARFRVLMARRG